MHVHDDRRPAVELHRGAPARWAPIATGAAMAAGAAVVFLRDPSQPGHYPTCPLKALTGLDCTGCGSLRGTHALLHGDLFGAVGHNALLVPGAVLVLWLWAAWMSSTFGRGRVPTLRPTPLVAGSLIAIAVGFAVVRNLPGFEALRS
ncbi:MAG: DUF2752 domain-containing protein [Actinobacteria bacterium]|nr:DUF2752 domain-containing protein [Actinomycetota bacterium]